MSSAYPPDEELWASQSGTVKPPRRIGGTIAIVSVVAAVIGAAVVFNANRLRGATDEVATQVQTPPAAESADAHPDSESSLAASEEQGSQAAAPIVLPAPQAAEPTSPPRQHRVAEPGSALAPADTGASNARDRARAPFVFARSAVTVSESQNAAALTIRRSGGAAETASVVWWCKDGTAIANKDFADLGRRTETLAAGETSRRIFVPIIKDGKAEANKHFFVYLGEYDGGHRHLQVLSTARVEIDDND